jgi:hypothetical protein
MEAADAFAEGIDNPTDDPFASVDEEFRQSDPLAGTDGGDMAPTPTEPAEPAEEIPIVNAAGEVVNAAGERIEDPTLATPAPVAASPAVSPVSAPPAVPDEPPVAEPDPTPAVAPMDGATTAQSAEQTDSAIAAQEAEASEVRANADRAEGNVAAAQAEDREAAQEMATSAQALDQANDDAIAEANAERTDGTPAEDAPVPEPTTDKKGAVTHRQYMLFQPEGAGKWREVAWYETKAGKMVPKGTDGAKRQKVCLARGQGDALRIGFRAVGSPEGGAKLVAVALTYFQVRHVEPNPEPPSRQKLTIR